MDANQEESVNHVLTSRDGTTWNTSYEAAGKRPTRNIVSGHLGFQSGLRPRTCAESFQSVCDEIMDATVVATNLGGRRYARQNGSEWKRINREEMDDFIGLHILAGETKYPTPIAANSRFHLCFLYHDLI